MTTRHNYNTRSFYCYLISQLLLLMHTSRACSPPRSKYGDNTVRQLSLLQRSEKAKTILIGTVLQLYEDRFRRSVIAKVAVHMKIKGEFVNHVVTVNGFGSNTEGFGSKTFFTETHADCTDTNVELYGSYLFFLQQNEYGSYYVDEINLQSAAVGIPCRNQISSRIKRILKKFRRIKTTEAQCNDLMKSNTSFDRKCLRTKILSRYLKELKYRNLRPRQTYCALKKVLENSRTMKTKSTNDRMSDDIAGKRENSIIKQKNLRKRKLKKRRRQKNKNTKIVVYSQQKDFIIRSRSDKTVRPRDNEKLSTSWRLLEKLTKTKRSNAKTIYLHKYNLAICLIITIVLSF